MERIWKIKKVDKSLTFRWLHESMGTNMGFEMQSAIEKSIEKT